MSIIKRACAGIVVIAFAALPAAAQRAEARQAASLPAQLSPEARGAVEHLADSLRAAGLPVAPVYAKAAEGVLKHATDAQIVAAVRGLAKRFFEVHAALGASLDESALTAAATALASGVPLRDIGSLRDAAGGGAAGNMDFATALVAAADLVAHEVPVNAAVGAVQSLLVRRAPAEGYAQLRTGVMDDIAAGRKPEEAARLRADAIVRALPAGAGLRKPPVP